MNNLEITLQKQVSENKTPSIQYILFDRDSIIHSYNFGLAEVLQNKAITPATTYNAFSVTKTFTAIAVLQLADLGLLRLDDQVRNYFPSLTVAGNSTIRQLLTHTAGIPNPIPMSWIHLDSEHNQTDYKKNFDTILSGYSRPKSDPNGKFAYSNLGYVLLGQLIEKVSGVAYEKYITDNIIKVLELQPHELGFEITNQSQHAKGYQERWSLMNGMLGFLIDKSKFMSDPEGRWKPFKNYYVNGAAYGGLIGTPSAFVKYLKELLNPDCKLLSHESRKLLFSENFTNNGKPTGMCLSWYTGQIEGRRFYAHAGGGGGYYCEIRIYPEDGIGSVVFFNRTGVSDERFLDKPDGAYFGSLKNGQPGMP